MQLVVAKSCILMWRPDCFSVWVEVCKQSNGIGAAAS